MCMNTKKEEKKKEEYIEAVRDNLVEKLSERFTDYTIKSEVEPEIMKITLCIGVKFLEISEDIASDINEAIVEGEITEEEADEAFINAYEEELEWLNEEYVLRVEGKISTPLVEVEFSPKYVEKDYDMAGMLVEIYLKTTDFEPKLIADYLFELIESAIQLS